MRDFRQLLSDKYMEIRHNGNKFKYHFLDLDISWKESMENAGMDFTKDWVIEKELGDFITYNLEVDYTIKYNGTYFFIRFIGE